MSVTSRATVTQKAAKTWAEDHKSFIKRRAGETSGFWEDLVDAMEVYIKALNDSASYSAQIQIERTKDAFKLSLWNKYSLELLVDDFTGDIFYRFLAPRITCFQGKPCEILAHGYINPGFYGTHFSPELYFTNPETEYENQRRQKLSALTNIELEEEPLAPRVAKCLLEILLSGHRGISRLGE